ncbi:hypothetical protein A2U01_0114845, partial [Trifolium medium]|nr:hypothetical protein [Trifolium medium]
MPRVARRKGRRQEVVRLMARCAGFYGALRQVWYESEGCLCYWRVAPVTKTSSQD